MSRVVVTGARGQVGQALVELCPSRFTLYSYARDELDIADHSSVDEVLSTVRPDMLINAAAYTAVDNAEHEADAAMRVNHLGSQVLAESCREQGIRLVHISTDFIFDGTAFKPYAVDAPAAPLGIYGQSKWLGEKAIREVASDHLIVRTGWVYSHRGSNFFKTMLRLHQERSEISVISDQVGTPTRAESLATALWRFSELRELHGTYHWSDAGVCSWYDFAVAIGRSAAERGVLASPAKVKPICSDEYPTPAKRPHYSVLDKSTSWRELGYHANHWEEELARAVECCAAALELPQPA
ncbi:MAG: dTDP-4-dehydrorhamnose reductase [Pseudomonadota bacterium]